MTMKLQELKEKQEQAIARRRAAKQFSNEWFIAKAEIEELSQEISKIELADRLRSRKITDEQLAVMDYVLSDDYDDD